MKKPTNQDIEIAMRVVAIIQSELSFVDKVRGVRAFEVRSNAVMHILLNGEHREDMKTFFKRLGRCVTWNDDPASAEVQEICGVE
jgi:hypothetical protein